MKALINYIIASLLILVVLYSIISLILQEEKDSIDIILDSIGWFLGF